MMTYIIVYVAIGIVLGFLCRVENDEFAILSDGMKSVAVFVFLWPVIVWFAVDKIIRNGVTFKVKGKEVWKSKGRR